MFIDCGLSFRTGSPALSCSGKMVLFPLKNKEDEAVSWKIWVLSTRVDHISQHPEDETLLSSASRDLESNGTIETDVLIVGAGTSWIAQSDNASSNIEMNLTFHSGLMTAARLKALGVESILADRNAQVGDNWARRYDCLEFHIPTSNCELPYRCKLPNHNSLCPGRGLRI